MAVGEDLLTQLDKISRQQQAANSGGLGTAGPGGNAPALRGLERAVSRYSSVPSTDALGKQVGVNLNPPPIPPNDVQPAGPPQDFTPPSGPSGGDILVLTGLMKAFDFLNTASNAPAFLGKYRDPNTGLTYTYNPENDGSPEGWIKTIGRALHGPADMFPSLAMLMPDIAGAVYVQKKYGLNPFEQMAQAFSFVNSKEMTRAAQSSEAAGTIEGTRAAIQVGLGIPANIAKGVAENAWKLATGKAFLADPAYLQSVKELPNVIQGDVDYVRAEALKASEGDAGDFSDFVSNAVNPFWLVAGGPIGKFAKMGLGALSKLPLVSPVAKVGVGKVEDLWSGIRGSKLFQPTPAALAHNQAENVFNTLGGLFFKGGGKEREVTDGLSFIKELRDFMTQNPEDLKGAWFEQMGQLSPKDALATMKTHSEDVNELLNLAERNWTLNPEVQNVQLLMDDMYGTLKGKIQNSLFDSKVYRAQRNGKFGAFFKALDAYDATVESFAQFWKPLTLNVRTTWLLNNLSSGMMLDFQRYGSLLLHKEDAIKEMINSGLINPAHAELFGGKAGMAVAAEALYTREGYNLATGGTQHLSSFLNKVPILSQWMNFVGDSNQLVERGLHAQTTALAYSGYMKEQVRKIVSSLPETMQPYFEDVGSDVQFFQRLNDLTKDVVDYANFLPSGKMSLSLQTKASVAVAQARKAKGSPLSAQEVRDVLNKEVRDKVLSEGIVKRQAAMKLDEFGIHQLDDAFSAGGIAPDHPVRAKARAFLQEKADATLEKESHFKDVMNSRLAEFTKDTVAKASGRGKNAPLASQMEQEGLRLAGIQKAISENIQKVVEDYNKTRPAINASTWKTSRQLHEKEAQLLSNGDMEGRKAVVDQVEQLWDGFWNVTNKATERSHNKYTSLYNIGEHGIAQGWSPKKTAKVMADWMKKEEVYSIPENIQRKVDTLHAIAQRQSPLTKEEWESLAREANVSEDHWPTKYVDYVKVTEKDVDAELAELDAAIRSFNGTVGHIGRNVKAGTVKTIGQLEQEMGRSMSALNAEMRDRVLLARDMAIKDGKTTQMDYMGGRVGIDNIMSRVFPFWFWQSRYMMFQARWAAKNPVQALQSVRMIGEWMKQNENRPPWQKFNLTPMVLDAGTPHQMDINFNPVAMFFPMGTNIANLVSFADPNDGEEGQNAIDLLTNFAGGGMWPHIPILAGQLGLDIGGGPKKSIGDALKTLTPVTTLARQGVNALPGMAGATMGLLTDSEVDQVVNAIRQDANAGLIPPNIARQAAVSVKEGQPNELGLEYVSKIAPERVGSTVVRQQIGAFSGEREPQKLTSEVYTALENAKTEAERNAIYQNYPGLGISITGKTGDALELALIHAAAPQGSDVLRSIYYQLHRKELDQVTARLDMAKGKEEDVVAWKLRSATPESFEAFRQAGGNSIVPSLVNYWTRGTQLDKATLEKLSSMYKNYGMGSLTFDDWKNKILPDAYFQWVTKRSQAASQIGVGKMR